VELLFESALLPDGIAAQVSIAIAADGTIERVSAGSQARGATAVRGLALPGMPNLHSHAFQRAMAGAAELRGPGQDSFWTWRDTMYRFVGRLGPEDVDAVAAFLYLEMLEAGYTSVGEFHYVHHQPDGRPYADAAALALAVRAAAERAGIRQVLLPTLYQTAGFGGQPAQPAQRRFLHDTGIDLPLAQRFEQIDAHGRELNFSRIGGRLFEQINRQRMIGITERRNADGLSFKILDRRNLAGGLRRSDYGE